MGAQRETMAAGAPAEGPRGAAWPAELELWFAPAEGRTRLRRRHRGPLVVQQPFYPENDGTCHVYLLHPPGGVAGGDTLTTRLHLAQGAQAVLTTPGATKFYRAPHVPSAQTVLVDVAAGAVCEYLPQETILFDGADTTLTTRVALTGDAVYLGWEIFSLGRPAAGERFANGRLSQMVLVERDGRPVWFERMALDGGSPLAGAPFALAGQAIVGTMIYAGALPDDAADRVRAAVGPAGEGVFSASHLEGVLVCRYLGPKAYRARELFVQAWNVLRTAGLGKTASAPRIWAA